MITITQYQEVFGKPELKVVSPSGTYNEEDLLMCAQSDNLSNPICMYQAQFIAFGSSVYQQDEVLSDSQVSALLQGEPIDEVIGNEDLIENKGIIKPQEKVEPKIVPETAQPEIIQETSSEPAIEHPHENTEEVVTPITETTNTETIIPEEMTEINPESPTSKIIKKTRIARATKRKVA